MLKAKRLAIEDVIVVSPRRFEDSRGYFQEVFNDRQFQEVTGVDVDFVQDNESMSKNAGTIRGLHFQLAPSAQGKLVRVVAGRALDVVVDLRIGSPTFGHHVSVWLDAVEGRQVWVPPGMAHGFCTTEPNTVLGYKVTGYYDAKADRSLRWSDPDLGIDWPLGDLEPQLSNKDSDAPTLAELKGKGDVFD